MFANSLQLNIGIIAACASFLKPLLGRLLKLNSTAPQHTSDYHYNRSGRTGAMGASGSRTLGTNNMGNDYEIELQTKTGVTVGASAGRSSAEDGHGDPATSDTNSEQVILKKGKNPGGIIATREFTVQYDDK